MHLKQALCIGVLFSITTLNVQAASLSGYTVNGVDLVYSSNSNVTWTNDANLFKTMYDANPNGNGLHLKTVGLAFIADFGSN
jgi:hypothetical protein